MHWIVILIGIFVIFYDFLTIFFLVFYPSKTDPKGAILISVSLTSAYVSHIC
jgi:hypothetical protein